MTAFWIQTASVGLDIKNEAGNAVQRRMPSYLLLRSAAVDNHCDVINGHAGFGDICTQDDFVLALAHLRREERENTWENKVKKEF